MGWRGLTGGSSDRLSSSVIDDEKGMDSHIQSEYQDSSPWVSLFWRGGGCEGCRNGFSELGQLGPPLKGIESAELGQAGARRNGAR